MSLSRKQIDDLEPRERRFDVALTQDFVISVHPNGIKTWAFIDERAGQLHRKTLGVWPEMDLDAAQKAVASARETRTRMVAAAQDASAIPSPVEKTLPAGYRQDSKGGPAWVAPTVLIAVIALGMAGWLVGRQLSPEQVAEAPAAVDDSDGSSETAGEAGYDPDSLPDVDRPDSTVRGDDPAIMATATGVPAEPPVNQDQNASDVISQAPAVAGTTAGSDGLDATVGTAVGIVDETRQPSDGAFREREPRLDTAMQSSASPDAESRPAVGATSAMNRPAQTASIPNSSAANQGAEVNQPAADATPVTPVSSDSGNVQRALLSSGIENREPIDALDGTISVSDDGPASLYYFNDLRRMTGHTVSHRWTKDGVLISQRSMTIGGWRWRLYSSVDLPPDASGEWSVQLLDENGGELHRQDFTLVRGFR